MKTKFFAIILALLVSVGTLAGCEDATIGQILDDVTDAVTSEGVANGTVTEILPIDAETNPGGFTWAGMDIPEWDGASAYVELNNGLPLFDAEDMARTDAFETYSELDSLGRCGVAYANICRELMPTEDRGEIGSVKPSGWHTVRYNGLVSGNYLYNRCHLIGFQLAGENANPQNLITGTRYLNIDGMLDHENEIADYIVTTWERTGTDTHVLYRVTPVFQGDELVARGVVMEAYSVEDGGDGICFCIFAYNAQPGVGIDYMTGDSWRLDGLTEDEIENGPAMDFVLNSKSGKFHKPDCQYACSISPENRVEMHEPLVRMFEAGYEACGSCHPDQVS